MYKLRLPALGQTMEHGLISAWLRNEGDAFKAGDALYEVESDKATIVVEATRSGTLRRVVAQVGDEIDVGRFVAIVAEGAEMLTDEAVAQAVAEELAAPTKPSPSPSAASTQPASLPGTVRKTGKGRRATPRARALAERLGLDLAGVHGTGPDESITADDVERAAAIDEDGPAVSERRPLHGVPRAMAEAVTRSWSDVPQFVQQVWADASGLVAAKARESEAIEEAHGVALSYTDLLLAAVVRAIDDVPEANARFGGEEIVVFEDVNLSVAIATDGGLVAPVIRGAQDLSVGELACRLRELAARAHAGRLEPSDLAGGTITVSNLGMHGVETGVPLVVIQQAAIVFAGALVERPIAVEGRVEIHPQLGLAIGFDHRVLDGVQAARFTSALKRIVEAL